MSLPRLGLFLFSSCLLGASVPAINAPASVSFLNYEEPQFPASLAMTPVLAGHAEVVFTTDSAGKIDDALILSTSHPAFGESILSAVEKWRLKPAPSPEATPWTPSRREIMSYDFQRHGAIVSLTHRDSTIAVFSTSLDNAAALRTVNWRDLPSPPARIASPNPQYPAALRAQGVTGSAIINFVIDSSGAVRVPAVTAADHPEFAAASLAAIKQWRFAPPLREGVAVNVEAERRFTFGKPR